MALADFQEHLTGQQVQVVYHGGCPDGCLAALILRNSIQKYSPSSLDLFPTSHAGRNADQLAEGSTAIFADVSPTQEDEEQLRRCRIVLVLDHHASAAKTLESLQKALPMLVDFSDMGGAECGASIANRFCSGTCSPLVPDWVLHLFHRLDVFQHPLPSDLFRQYESFKGFITQNGIGKCTIELVEEMLADVEAALATGDRLYRQTSEHTKTLFEGRTLLVDAASVCVWAVEIGTEGSQSMDLELYQSFIDTLASPEKYVIFATLNRARLPSGLWAVGLRRAGEGLDVGQIAQELGKCFSLGFKTGGGHPYAAGAQCEDFALSADSIGQEIVRVCQGIPKEKPVKEADPKRAKLWQCACLCSEAFFSKQ